MASLTEYSHKKQMKIVFTTQSLALKAWEMIPSPFLKAMHNALNCEMETRKTMSNLGQIKQKVLEQKKARTHKISFGCVEEHSGNKIQEKEICFETKPKEMITCILVDHFPSAINDLIVKGFPLAAAKKEAYGIANLLLDPKTWSPAIIGSTHESLVQEAEFADISMETIKTDLKKIYSFFRKETVAILGYKTSYKMPYKQKEKVYNPYKGCWEWNGNWIWMAPNLRLYIIKVVKDEDFCATLIQTAWRQRRDKKILKLLKGFLTLTKFISGKRAVISFITNN